VRNGGELRVGFEMREGKRLADLMVECCCFVFEVF
jgi:hypothetical protein